MIEKAGGDLLQWLRGFYYVVNCGSVARAAEHMQLRQSAISHQLKNLEKEFSTTLFHRSNKALALTSEGHVLYEKAIQLFGVLGETRQALAPFNGIFQGQISMSVTHAVAQNFLPPLIKRFYAQNPQVSFCIRGGSFAQIVDDVMKGYADLGIVNKENSINHPPLECHELFGARLLVVSPAGNPFGLPQECSLPDLQRVPFLGFLPDYALGRMIRDAVRNYNITLHTIVETYSYNALISYVRGGVGVTILDAFAVQDVEGLHIHNLVEELPLRRYMLIQRQDRSYPPQTKAFVEAVLHTPPPLYCKGL